MAHHYLFTEAQRDCERVNILRHSFLGITVSWFCRLPESAEVWRDHRMSFRKFRYQRTPHVTVLCIAVQQDYGITFPRDQIVKPDSANGCEAVLNRGPRLGPNDCGCGQTKDENCGGGQ